MSGRVLITGAAGNLGGLLSRHLLDSDLDLRLMVHRTPLPFDLRRYDNGQMVRADLAAPESLARACAGVDCVVHFGGVLFRPGPERFLPVTNTVWTRNLLSAARAAGVRRFVLISFPHVEGPSHPARPATDRLDRRPVSVHARTRRQSERDVLSEAGPAEGIVLRSGMVYGRGVLMVDFARRLMKHHLLPVWPRPTTIHLIALQDFLDATEAAIRRPDLRGIYNLGDERPTSLQAFLDRAAAHWGYPRPWRAPRWTFFCAARTLEAVARPFGWRTPLTRDFVRIGMVDYAMDTDRMRRELLAELTHPTLEHGLADM